MDQVYIKQLLKNIRELLPSLSLISIGFGLILLVAAGLFSNAFLEIRSGDITPEAAIDFSHEYDEFGNLIVGQTGDYSDLKSFLYVVAPGDSTWKLAEKFLGDGYRYTQIESINSLPHNSHLEIGQVLRIDVERIQVKQIIQDQKSYDVGDGTSTNEDKVILIQEKTHVVSEGESLWSIASDKYGDGYAWSAIYQENREAIGPNPGLIYSGTELNLPIIDLN